jgi:flagellar biosynthesis/type III secretory pathway protein FliH
MNLTLNDIKNEVWAIHLPYMEEDEQVMELIEKAYRLGWEDGYDEAKSKFATIYSTEVLEVINKVQNSEK